MTNYFIFDGINSKDMGIKIERHNNFSSPQRRVESISIPGRTGNILIDDGSYENQIFEYELILECDSKKGIDISKKANEISSWLHGDYTYKTLTFSNSDKTYKAVVINKIDITQMFKKFAKALVVFEAYEVANVAKGKSISVIKNEGTFINNTNREVKPILKLVGEGDCIININNQEMKIKGIEGHIIVDSYNMDCYKKLDDGFVENNNKKMFGSFPVFNIGENEIKVNGAILEVLGYEY